jgi:hypothetical protein
LNVTSITADPTILTLKWGDRYGADYVNTLYRAAESQMGGRKFRFLCFTDQTGGLLNTIETRPIPDMPIDRSVWTHGMFPKLLMFIPDILAKGTPVLFLDLDVMITGNLTRMFDRITALGGLHVIREWNPTIWRALPVNWRPNRGSNSSVVGFRAGEQTHLWSMFKQDPDGVMRQYHNDQIFIDAHAKGRHYWPNSWCGSFKRHCAWHWPLNYVFTTPARPRNFSVLTFHGRPDYHSLLLEDGAKRWGTEWRFGTRPVSWVKDYCDRFRSL